MVAMLLASLAIPAAFEGGALLFAVAYLGVRVLHILLFSAGTADVNVRQAARALAPTAVLAPALLIVAAFIGDPALRVAIWIVALAIDYIGGAVRGIEGWRLSPGTSPNATASSSSSRSENRSWRSAWAPPMSSSI